MINIHEIYNCTRDRHKTDYEGKRRSHSKGFFVDESRKKTIQISFDLDIIYSI